MSSRTIEAMYPLSPVQEGILFHAIAFPNEQVYLNQLDCTLCGALDPQTFRQAWQLVIDRHAILRTSITWRRQGQPVQVVQQKAVTPWAFLDWRHLSPEQQEQQLATLAQQEQARGFELSQAPLMRLHVLQFGEQRFHLLWSYHHVLLDGWSVSLVLQEVFACYQSLHEGISPLQSPRRPYQDYIAWLQRQDLARAESFWRGALRGFSSPTPLVMARRNDMTVSNGEPQYAEEWLALSRSTSLALQAFARECRLTLNTLAQAAWALLLSRYSGEVDVVFGVTTSGRSAPLAGIEHMVGLFINTLPLRVSVNPEQPLLTWLRQVQAQNLEMLQYEYTPLVEALRWSQVAHPRQRQISESNGDNEQRARGASLFESLLVFENYPVDPSLREEGAALHIAEARAVERTTYPLTLVVRPGEQTCFALSYQPARFEATTIRRMLAHLQTSLEAMPACRQQRVSTVPLLTSEEYRRLLVDWNVTGAPYAQGRLLHELVEEQAQRTPDAVAITFGQQQLTYREFDQRANQLSHYLQAHGVEPEMRVGVCQHRSLALFISLLAVLKAGGAYLPLVTDHAPGLHGEQEPHSSLPSARLAFMLQDAHVSLALAQQSLLHLFPDQGMRVVCLDTEAAHIEQCSRSKPASWLNAQNLAYVIYTSGSTGRPKGVLISHAAVVNHMLTLAGRYALQPGDRVLQFSSLSFDVAIEEMFPAWSSGASVVASQHTALLSPLDLALLAQRERLSVLNLPAAFWHDLVDELPSLPSPAASLASLRLLVTGSDAVSSQKLALWREHVGVATRFINAYGPTEATITSLLYEPARLEAQAASPGASAIVPIGGPLANMRAYVLHAQLEPAPPGIAGELYLGGTGLARGYLNRPDLTAEFFVPDPFGAQPGARLYRTGDLVRFNTSDDGDGNVYLEFLGRADHQVKLRGFRIEPGEIEACLRQHPLVREAVVLLRQSESDARLVAYLVLAQHQQGAFAATDMRHFLQAYLPAYMLPSAYVLLEKLPVTTSGKVDRRSLPAPEQQNHEPLAAAGYVAPQSDIERAIAAVWQAVLQLDKVGMHDNFFDLGGNSLLLARVHRQLRAAFAQELSMIDLFQRPTIFDLAAYLSQQQPEPPSFAQSYDRASMRQSLLKRQMQARQASHGGEV